MTLRIIVAGWLAVLVPVSVLAQGAVYKWKDENGKVHFSNVPSEAASREGATMVAPDTAPPAEPAAPAPADEMGAPAEIAPPAEPAVAAPVPAGTPGPFSSLSDEGFSTRVTGERLKLRREITAAKRALDEVTKDYDGEVARKRVPTPQQIHDRIFVGVTGVEDGAPPDREEELRKKKEQAGKRVEEIRARFAALETEAVKRYGGLPAWWLTIE
ncbi:MAG: DUF4124 domain-containing protein [Candidatus Binatia bacterium]